MPSNQIKIKALPFCPKATQNQTAFIPSQTGLRFNASSHSVCSSANNFKLTKVSDSIARYLIVSPCFYKCNYCKQIKFDFFWYIRRCYQQSFLLLLIQKIVTLNLPSLDILMIYTYIEQSHTFVFQLTCVITTKAIKSFRQIFCIFSRSSALPLNFLFFTTIRLTLTESYSHFRNENFVLHGIICQSV